MQILIIMFLANLYFIRINKIGETKSSDQSMSRLVREWQQGSMLLDNVNWELLPDSMRILHVITQRLSNAVCFWAHFTLVRLCSWIFQILKFFSKSRFYPNEEFEYASVNFPFARRRVDSVGIGSDCSVFCVSSAHSSSSKPVCSNHTVTAS